MIRLHCLRLLCLLVLSALLMPNTLAQQSPPEEWEERFPFCFVHDEAWNGVTGVVYSTVHISKPAFYAMSLRHPDSYEGECKEPARFDFCEVVALDGGQITAFNAWRQQWNYILYWNPKSYIGKCKGEKGSYSPSDKPNRTPVRVNQCGLGTLPSGYGDWKFEFRGRYAGANEFSEDVWYKGKVSQGGEIDYNYPYGDYPSNNYPQMTNQAGENFIPFVVLAVFIEDSHIYDVAIDPHGQCYLVIDPSPVASVPIAPRLGAPYVIFDFGDTR